jgi:hypothetical protein
MTKHKPHGGKRNGSGRPKGSTNATHKEDIAVTKSVSMPASKWDKIDAMRGASSRGKFIAQLIDI